MRSRSRGAGGTVGTGYTYAGVGVSRSLATFIAAVIAPRVIGVPWDSPTRPRPWADLFQETLLIGRRDFAVRAVSAVDLALWDLLGQVTREPVARLLGGVRDRVDAYASGGYFRPGDPIAAIDREISRYLELVFRDAKLKVGGLEPSADAARVERARSLLGPGGRLALGANNAWRTPTDAIRFIRIVEEFDPWWIEEPLAPDKCRWACRDRSERRRPCRDRRDPLDALGLRQPDLEGRRRHPAA